MKAVIFTFLSILELIYCQGNSGLGSLEKLFPSMKQTKADKLTSANDSDDKKLKAFLESISSDNEMRENDSVTSHKDEDEEKLTIFLESILSDEWMRNYSTTVISDEDREQKLKRVIDYIFPNPNKERKGSSTAISVKLDDDKKQIERPITSSRAIIVFPDD